MNVQENSNDIISEKVKEITKGTLTDNQKAEAIFLYIRDSIEFGWIFPFELPAEEVLKRQKGLCMHKTTLLVEMARRAGLKARYRFLYVH